MHTFLIIVPEGGMLFEAAGIADILMQANRLSAAETPLYQIAVATTQSHRVVHGLSGLACWPTIAWRISIRSCRAIP